MHVLYFTMGQVVTFWTPFLVFLGPERGVFGWYLVKIWLRKALL